MSGPDDWTDDTCVTEPTHRGRLALLVVIAIIVAGIGVLGFIGVALGTKALRLVGEFVVHTERIATAGRVVPTSLGKRIEVRWDAASHRLIIHTRLRGRLIGLLWLRDAGLHSRADAAHRAEAVWRLFRVERIPPG